jgi:hypothetical protein
MFQFAELNVENAKSGDAEHIYSNRQVRTVYKTYRTDVSYICIVQTHRTQSYFYNAKHNCLNVRNQVKCLPR